MTASGAGTRTKLRLTRGESSARSWELVASSTQTTLTIGAGADCNWVIHAEGVRARHVSLQWDGASLRVADLGGAGGASLDGEALGTAWREVPDLSELQIGGASISVETSRGRDSEMHPLDGFMAAGFGAANQRGSQPGSVPSSPNPATPGRPGSQPSSQPLTAQQPAPSFRKATLVGVAPISADTIPLGRTSSVPPADGFRVLRPSESADKQKRVSSAPPAPDTPDAPDSPDAARPSNVAPAANQSSNPPPGRPAYDPPVQFGFPAGMAAQPPRTAAPEPILLETPAPSSVPTESASPSVEVMPDAPQVHAPSPAKVAAMRSGTLIGVAVPDVLQSLRGKRTAGASLADDSQRTLHGYVPLPPGSLGSAAAPPAVVARSGTLIQVLDRGNANASDATQRIGSAWQESPQGDVSSFDGPDTRPSGVLDSPVMPGRSRNSMGTGPETWPQREMAGDTLDDPPATNRAPAGGFPWRYIGIAMLTVVAYFAWLYLLDHL